MIRGIIVNIHGSLPITFVMMIKDILTCKI